MKFEDTSQNLRARLSIVNMVVVLLLTILGVRLYLLQMVWESTIPRSPGINGSGCCQFPLLAVSSLIAMEKCWSTHDQSMT